jgi:hypothetical protein
MLFALLPVSSQKNLLWCLSKSACVPSANRKRLIICKVRLDRQVSVRINLVAEDTAVLKLILTNKEGKLVVSRSQIERSYHDRLLVFVVDATSSNSQ